MFLFGTIAEALGFHHMSSYTNNLEPIDLSHASLDLRKATATEGGSMTLSVVAARSCLAFVYLDGLVGRTHARAEAILQCRPHDPRSLREGWTCCFRSLRERGRGIGLVER